MTDSMKANQVTGTEALKLFAQGNVLTCPVCSARIVSIPREVAEGSLPLGIECPVSQQHYLVYRDASSTMKQMRERMKSFLQK